MQQAHRPLILLGQIQACTTKFRQKHDSVHTRNGTILRRHGGEVSCPQQVLPKMTSGARIFFSESSLFRTHFSPEFSPNFP